MSESEWRLPALLSEGQFLRFVASARAHARVTAVAYALQKQLADEIPGEEAAGYLEMETESHRFYRYELRWLDGEISVSAGRLVSGPELLAPSPRRLSVRQKVRSPAFSGTWEQFVTSLESVV